MTWENLTEEELCDLMCGKPEEDEEEDEEDASKKNQRWRI